MILGNGGTIWGMADASPPDRRRLADASRSDRRSSPPAWPGCYGFLVFDDTGSEWTREGDGSTFRLFPNRFVYSRDQNRASAPYFTSSWGRGPPAACRARRHQGGTGNAATCPPGEAIVSWITPRDAGPAGTLGFFVDARRPCPSPAS